MVRIVRHDPHTNERDDRSEIFIGEVFSRTLVSDSDAPSLRLTSVSFCDGARNRFHTHTTEQVLIVTNGNGILVTDDAEQRIQERDVVIIPAMTRHWHGAQPGMSMTHLAVLLPGKMTVDASDSPAS